MYTVLNYTILGIIFLMPFLLAVSMFTGLVAGARKPFWFVTFYFLLIFYAPNASWGLEVQSIGGLGNIYTRGAGLFLLPFVNLALIGLFVVVSTSRYFKMVTPAFHNLKPFIWAFTLIIAGNIVVGLALGYKVSTVLGDKGLIHMANMLLVFGVVTLMFKERKDLDVFINVFLFAAVTRGLYGAVRFAAFGGDPANFYANFEKIDVKLTFFDVNDGFIATMAAFIFAWRLTAMQNTRNPRLKAFYWFCVILEVFIVIFSFRRTSWIGFGLAAILFAMSQPKRLRSMLFLGYVGIGMPIIVAQALKRMVTSSRMESVGLLEKLAPDVFGSNLIGTQSPRLVELAAAWDTIIHRPILGVGIWGEYNGYGIPLLYFHKNDFTWMHSGVLHIWLKCGFIGVILLLGLWWRYGQFIRTRHKMLDRQYQGLMLAAAAGALFYIPTWLMGTPVIELRTMLLIGLVLGLPYSVYTLGKKAKVPHS